MTAEMDDVALTRPYLGIPDLGLPRRRVAGLDVRAWLAILLCAVLVWTGLGPAAAAETVLRRANHDEPEALDPHKSDAAEDQWLQEDMLIGLTRLSPRGDVVPDLAQSWELSADGRIWTFHLRPDLKWSDGSALTADDFVWSLRRAVDPLTASPYASILFPIVGADAINRGAVKDLTTLGVAAPDPRTVVLTLNEPTPYFAGVMALSVADAVPRQAIERYGDRWVRPGNIVCSGAYMMTEWVPQDHITMVRNPHFYDAGSVQIDRVQWQVIPDDATALRSFRDGETDIARVPTTEVPWARKFMPELLHIKPNLWDGYLIANVQKPPLSDVRLRQAISMVIDRDTITGRVAPHGQTPAIALIPPGIAGYTPQAPEWAAWPMAQRIERARVLLAEAGYGPTHPLAFSIFYPAGRDTTKIELGAIAQMLRPLGVEVTTQTAEAQVFQSMLRHHDFEIAYYGWIADYPDPWTFLSIFKSNAGGLNESDYRNPEFDALLAKASATQDSAARFDVLQQAERLIARDQPVMPIEYNSTPRVVARQLRGYFDNGMDRHRSADMWFAPELSQSN